jgi:hypothetical protein
MNPELLDECVSTFAEIYPGLGATLRVLSDAGIPSAEFNLQNSPLENWKGIFQGIEKPDDLRGLLQVALEGYPRNPGLRRLQLIFG